MKYVSPKIELSMLEVKDVITASGVYCEIENNDGKGSITFSAFNIFN